MGNPFRRWALPGIFVSCALFLLLWSPSSHAFEIPARNSSESPLPQSVAPNELVLSVAVLRHGDRAPQRHAPSFAAGDRDSLVAASSRLPIDNVPWDVDYGQLTRLGMEQTREFGHRLRERYVVSKKGKVRGFLSDDYKHAETHVRSTDVDRTLVSAMHAMLGLYGANDKGEGAGDVVVPVHTVEYKRDALLDASARVHCPRFFAASQEMLQTEFVKGAILRNTELLAALPALAGVSAASLGFSELVDVIAALRDVRVAQRAHGVQQPANVTRFDGALDDIVARVAIAKWDVAGLGELVGGRLLKAVARRMEAMVGLLNGDEAVREWSREECNANGSDSDEDGQCPRKMVLYVGHDTTIFDVRSALGLNAVMGGANGRGVAPYASHVIFELRRMTRKDKKKFAKLKRQRREAEKGTSSANDVESKGMDAGEKYEYTVSVLTGSFEEETREVRGPFCRGKSKCSLDDFLEFVKTNMPAVVDDACALDDGTAPTESSTTAASARGEGGRRNGPKDGYGDMAGSVVRGLGGIWNSVKGIAGALFGLTLGGVVGYIAGSRTWRNDYDPIT